MACKEIQLNIEAYLDGELTLSDRRELEDHLPECAECQAMLDSVRSLNQAIKGVGYVSRPSGLKRRIKNNLRDLNGEEVNRFNWSHLLGVGGGSAAFASLMVWALMSFMLTSPMQAGLTGELISAHVRSLMVDHMTDVASSDRHTVKPWFNGRLDFSPNVVDLKQQGFPLQGGRLDYLQGQPVAALVYKRRAHVINLFIRKADTSTTAQTGQLIQQQGYQIISWQSQGLVYTTVSDLNPKELQEFSQKILNSGH